MARLLGSLTGLGRNPAELDLPNLYLPAKVCLPVLVSDLITLYIALRLKQSETLKLPEPPKKALTLTATQLSVTVTIPKQASDWPSSITCLLLNQ